MKYEALSYEWGPPEPTRYILVNGAVLSIRENLWLFLENLRKRKHDKWLFWADQICIDQQNITERNQQVQLMGDIYSGAIQVLAWLGPKADFAEGFEEEFEVRSHTFLFDKAPDYHSRLHELDFIMRATYWTRVWIIQEIFLARGVVFFIGRYTFRRAHLSYFCALHSRLVGYVKDPGREGEHHWPNYKRIHRIVGGVGSGQRKPLSLVDCLESFVSPYIRCTDPRDQVFALVSLMKPTDRPAVDYNIPGEEIVGSLVELLVFDKDYRSLPMEKGSRWGVALPLLKASLGLPLRWGLWLRLPVDHTAKQFLDSLKDFRDRYLRDVENMGLDGSRWTREQMACMVRMTMIIREHLETRILYDLYPRLIYVDAPGVRFWHDLMSMIESPRSPSRDAKAILKLVKKDIDPEYSTKIKFFVISFNSVKSADLVRYLRQVVQVWIHSADYSFGPLDTRFIEWLLSPTMTDQSLDQASGPVDAQEPRNTS